MMNESRTHDSATLAGAREGVSALEGEVCSERDDEGQTEAVRFCLPFFRGRWMEQYDYWTYITRRCLNLNELLFYRQMREFLSEQNTELESSMRQARETFVTQNALLSYADVLAEDYMWRKTFAKILIADEKEF